MDPGISSHDGSGLMAGCSLAEFLSLPEGLFTFHSSSIAYGAPFGFGVVGQMYFWLSLFYLAIL